MSVLDKLKFWKKEDRFDDFSPPPDFTAPAQLGPEQVQQPPSMEQFGMPKPVQGINELPDEFGLPQQTARPIVSPISGQQAPSVFPSQQPFSSGQQAFSQQSQFSQDQQFQLVSAKLDTIKAQLETVIQRLDRLDRKDEQHLYQQRWRSAM